MYTVFVGDELKTQYMLQYYSAHFTAWRKLDPQARA
jgi:hypothetical protein